MLYANLILIYIYYLCNHLVTILVILVGVLVSLTQFKGIRYF